MLRISVMGNHSRLAGAIVSGLARDLALEVLWLPPRNPEEISHPGHENCSVIVFIEEGKTSMASTPAHNLLWDDGCYHMIMISSKESPMHSEITV